MSKRKQKKNSETLFDRVKDIVNEDIENTLSAEDHVTSSILLTDINTLPEDKTSDIKENKFDSDVMIEDPAAEIFKMQKENSIQLPLTTMKKLELLERYEKENAALFSKVSELETKLAEYIEKIDAIDEEKVLLKEEIDARDRAYDTLNKEFLVLLKASDDYLLKISDLEFENARLKASQSSQNIIPQLNPAYITTPPPQCRFTAPVADVQLQTYTPPNVDRRVMPNVKYVKPTNGYTSWN